MNLLSTPTWVESPFVIARIGDFTFGTYTKTGDIPSINGARISYPNYITGLTVQKTNNVLNTYQLSMTYAIRQGDDPNLIDKILGTVSNDRTITLSYGDWSAPTFVFREEEAIITKVSSRVDFGSSTISYTINCTSKALQLKATRYNFPGGRIKPSNEIRRLLKDKTYGLSDLFTGMRPETEPIWSNFIVSDDQYVMVEEKSQISILDYLNYLVNCMVSTEDNPEAIIKSSRYYLYLAEDRISQLNGSYFKIVKVNASVKNVDSLDTFEVIVGYPTDNLITNFTVNNDDSWAILYKYSDQIDQDNKVYSINNQGELVVQNSPNISTSSKYYKTTEVSKSWWTQVTQFPVTASLTLKGLLRPAMLMSYVRIYSYFYGQKHTSSGLYIITKQEDSISTSGYRTTLSLTKVGADDDEIWNKIGQVDTEANATKPGLKNSTNSNKFRMQVLTK